MLKHIPERQHRAHESVLMGCLYIEIAFSLFSILFSLTYSLVYPFLSSIALKGKPKSLSGRIFGAINSSFSIGVNVMTFFFGFIAEIYGFNIMFKCASILILIGALLLFVEERRSTK